MAAKRLFIIDSMAMAFRNFHAFGTRGGLSTSQGLPTGAVFGSLTFLMKLLREERPDYIIAATDSREPTFRHKLYDKYKANRSEMPEDLVKQLPYMRQLFAALNIPLLAEPGLEADDLIGSLVTQHSSPDLHCYIVSGDKDFMQLVNDQIFLYSPKKAEEAKIIDCAGVREKFGCDPHQVIDILALIGDSSDNVPGVAGIGEKGAAQLIQKFGSLDAIYERLAEIANQRQRNGLEQNREMAYLSRQLVTIKTDAALPVSLDEMACRPEETLRSPLLLELGQTLEFRGIIRMFEGPKEEAAEELVLGAPLPSEKSSPVEKEVPCFATLGHEFNYQLINRPEPLKELLARLEKASAFAFDTETTGLDVVGDEPIGISFALREKEAFYIPLIEPHLEGIRAEDVLEALKPILHDATKLKIGHNIKFDWQMMRNVGVTVAGPFFDTMIAAHAINTSERQHNMDSCCLRYFNYAKIKTSTFKGADGLIAMVNAPLDQLTTYACEDADFTFRLYEHLHKELMASELMDVFANVEMPLVPILARMEQEGVFVDSGMLGNLSGELSGHEDRLSAKIYEIAGEEFNINSPKQLQSILFERLKIHETAGIKVKKTKSGYSTDVSVLEQLSDHHPLPATILDFRSVTKLKSTYVDALPQLINPKTTRVHTSFHQTGTATGRLSSTEPNLQNIPIRSEMGRKIRAAFRAQKNDYVLISADYSQIELRMLAHLADDANLTEAFQRGEDIHRSTAARIFAVEPESVTAEQRSAAKAINFGIIYGMGPQRLARETGVKMSEAKDFIERYFASYPGIKTYIQNCIREAEAHTFTRTIMGRRRHLPEILSKDRMTLKNAQNIAINSPVQGSAADLMKLAMVATQKNFEARGLGAKLLLQVHDELLIECPREEAAEVRTVVKETMENAMKLRVPLLAEVGEGLNWLEAH